MKKSSVSPKLKVLAFTLAAILFLFSLYKIATVLEFRFESPISDCGSSRVIDFEGIKYIPDGNVISVLLMGIDADGEVSDSGSYRNDGLADFIGVAAFNIKEKTCTVLHINRDTMTDMNALGLGGSVVGTVNAQIALSHSYGSGLEDSCINTKGAVSKLLYNIVISNYISLNMDGLPVINDLVGGVEVTLDDDLTAVDPALKKGETVLLNGEQAVKFVRARYAVENQTNLERMSRQRQYMDSFYSVFTKELTDEKINMNEVFDKIEPYMVTDCNTGVVSMLSDKIKNYEFKGVVSVSGKTETGEDGVEFYPDETELKKTVLDIFYKPE